MAFFQKQGVKFIIAACNTSSALALPVVAPISPIPIMGVIGAGAHRALEVTSNKKVGVIGTEATVESHAYAYALEELDPSVTVYERACPRLVPLIEAGHWEGEVVREPLRQYLTPLAKQDIDTLILGCTHYPFLLESIQGLLGPEVKIVDPAEATAKEARERLEELDL